VAIKVISEALIAQAVSQTQKDEIKSMFQNEVRVLSCVSHPNIVRLFGSSTGEDMQMALVFEHLPLGSLDGLIFTNRDTHRNLTLEQRVRIAVDIATGLSYLHGLQDVGERGEVTCVLHRDVKSANVALTADFTAKLIDVGLAKIVSRNSTGSIGLLHTNSGTLGTPGYIAPEVQFAEYGPASEIYSFGAILFELLSGKEAIHIMQPIRRLLRKKNSDFNVTFGVDFADRGVQWQEPPACVALERLLSLAQDCVEEDTEDRPRSMRAVLLVLRDVLSLLTAPSFTPVSQPSSTELTHAGVWAAELGILASMGFTNTALILPLLEQHLVVPQSVSGVNSEPEQWAPVIDRLIAVDDYDNDSETAEEQQEVDGSAAGSIASEDEIHLTTPHEDEADRNSSMTTEEDSSTIAPQTSDDVNRLKNEGNTHFKNEDFEAAIAHYTAALDIDPDHQASRLNRCQAYLKMEKFGLADEDASYVIDHSEHSQARMKALFARAVAHTGLGTRPHFISALEDLGTLLTVHYCTEMSSVQMEMVHSQISRVHRAMKADTASTKLAFERSPRFNPRSVAGSASEPTVPRDPPKKCIEMETVWMALGNRPDLFAEYLKIFRRSTFKRIMRDLPRNLPLLSFIFTTVRNYMVCATQSDNHAFVVLEGLALGNITPLQPADAECVDFCLSQLSYSNKKRANTLRKSFFR
jgi:serine/threonine protein kinase